MAFSVLPSLVYLLVLLTCTASLLSHDEECLALFEFKQTFLHQNYASFDDGGFQKFESWRKIATNTSDNGSDCCLWDGVACSNEGHVIGLDLSESSLRGLINSSSTLFNLVHLQMVNLSMNDFAESQIPSEIARLKQLRSLDLSNSGFNGQIPYEISHLIQLSSLDLSGNSLKLQTPSLENLVQNLTRLEELHLSGVEISSSIPHFLANLSSLRSIMIDNCSLQNEFPTAILQLPKLKLLSVENNINLTGFLPEFHNNSLLEYLNLASTGFGGAIPESVSKLNNLRFLSLGECHFSGRIPGSLSNLTKLTILALRNNELTGPVPSLANLSKLGVLELSDNNFEKGTLPNGLSKLTKLNALYVANMNIFDEIPDFLANLTELSVVAMRENFIFGHIPSSFMNITQLRTIDLGHNQLQGQLLSSFSNFKNLEYLNLEANNFSGMADLETFLGLNKLESLYLGNSRLSLVPTNNYTDGTLPELKYLGLSSCNLKEFPAFLRFQKKLIVLSLVDNKIEGLIPEWMWNNSKETLQMLEIQYNFITGFHGHPQFLPWVRLESLDISSNHLRGWLPIPPQTMIYYDASYNHLTGDIPSLICEVKSLQMLDMSCNNMSGTLPPCLGNLSNSLSLLGLRQNNFHGRMMNSFTHGSPMKRIDLSENRFTGQVSKSLANCTSLEVLSLGDNSFGDVFPFWLGTLAELQVLILRSNKFYGAIHQGPTIVSPQFPKLRIIDLSNNSFSGPLPEKYFESWNAIKLDYVGNSFVVDFDNGFQEIYQNSITFTTKGVKRDYEMVLKLFVAIDLSSNNFEGEIPQSLQDLYGLQSLNLSNNHFTGRVLPSLGNLKKLESLDLSQNELSGEIPQELLRLGFLAIFNVSFNHLDGAIPQGKQFNTFENNSYMGNPGLCGAPLSKECQNSKASTVPPTISNQYVSLLPSDGIDWIVIFSGVGSGLVIGVVFGNFLYARYSYWLIERFGLRKDRWMD